MSHDLGQIDLSGSGEERTWRIVIDCPAENEEQDYMISVHREITVTGGSGQIVQKTRIQEEALQMAPDSKFKPEREFTALQAVMKTPDVLQKIRDTVDMLLEEQKAAE